MAKTRCHLVGSQGAGEGHPDGTEFMNNESHNGNDESVDPFKEYAVVRNLAGDYSIWPTVKDVPAGWSRVGVVGTQPQCLDWIEANWKGPQLM
jgi:MbtH protein